MDVTTLYTNKPQKEGIETLCRAFDSLKKKNRNPYTHTTIRTSAQASPARKLLPINSMGKKTIYRRSKTALGTKMTVACANILMSKVETNILHRKKCVKTARLETLHRRHLGI